jgi:3-methyladenine DNA glycosylase AlkC
VTHPDPRVRRLASEGTRPLLPWGRHIAALKRDPARALTLIAPLAADPDEVVRRSAANHLNDVSRLDPDLALQHATRWTHDFGADAAGTVRHAVRTLVKKGHPEALQLLGFDTHAEVRLRGLALSARKVPVGGEIELTAELHTTGGDPVSACVDYAVRYASARGAVRVKVFKGTQVTLVPGQAFPVRFRRDFVPRTTRALYPGPHALEVRVNGVVVGEAPFDLV